MENTEAPKLTDILQEGKVLSVVTLDKDDINVSRVIEEVKRKQAEILKLKEVDQKNLQLIVQL